MIARQTLKKGIGFFLKGSLSPIFCLMGLLVCFGCSRTVTGGFDDSPDKKFRIYGRVYGALGKAFTDETRKTVRISIVTGGSNEMLLFREEIRVKGSDVSWNCIWDKDDSAKILIYTYGPHVYWEDAEKAGTPSNLLATVLLTYDKGSRKFTSQNHVQLRDE